MIGLLLVAACCLVPVREPWTPPEWGPPRKEEPVIDVELDTGLAGGAADDEPHRVHYVAWPGATLELLEHRVVMACESGIPEVSGRMRVTWDDGEVLESRGDTPEVSSRGVIFTFDCSPDGCEPWVSEAESYVPLKLDWWAIETADAGYDPVPDCDTVAERRRLREAARR